MRLKEINNRIAIKLGAVFTAVLMMVTSAMVVVNAETSTYELYRYTLSIEVPEGVGADERVYLNDDFKDNLEGDFFFRIVGIYDEFDDDFAYIFLKRDNSQSDDRYTELSSAEDVKAAYDSYGKDEVKSFCYDQFDDDVKLSSSDTVSGNTYFVKVVATYGDTSHLVYWTCYDTVSMIVYGECDIEDENADYLDAIVAGIDNSQLMEEVVDDDIKLVYDYDTYGDDPWSDYIIPIVFIIISFVFSALSVTNKSENGKTKKGSLKDVISSVKTSVAQSVKAESSAPEKNIVVEKIGSADECWGHEEQSSSYDPVSYTHLTLPTSLRV